MDKQGVSAALFLPLLTWTGAVLMLVMLGYPGVIWLTPPAWLLALPVGLRLRREPGAQRFQPGELRRQAALAGGLLGLGQLILFVGTLALAPRIANFGDDLPHSALVIAAVAVFSIPVTAGLAALAARPRCHPDSNGH